MHQTGLIELEAEISVARHRSFRAAAEELRMSRTAVSSLIRGLEARIGVLLFQRTTRSVALTAAGEMFIQKPLPPRRDRPANRPARCGSTVPSRPATRSSRR